MFPIEVVIATKWRSYKLKITIRNDLKNLIFIHFCLDTVQKKCIGRNVYLDALPYIPRWRGGGGRGGEKDCPVELAGNLVLKSTDSCFYNLAKIRLVE